MLKKRLFQIFVELTNGNLSSKMVKKITKSNLSRLLIPIFIKTYNINTYEILKDISDFKNLNDFFIRQVHPKLRPIGEGIISPTDGEISEIGKIEEDSTFVIKGQEYMVKSLLADSERAKKLAGGYYIIIYLNPKNYHRIHFPTSGKILSSYTLGKHSYPVNNAGLNLGDNVLSYNYRRIIEIENENTTYNLVCVGAQNVNSIIETYKTKEIEKSQEMGYFEFGSTVVLLFEKDSINIETKEKTEIKMGEKIAIFK